MGYAEHELMEEFPTESAAIQALKHANPDYVKLAVIYLEIDRQIHRLETEIVPSVQATLATLKKKRLSLKGEIAGILTASRSSTE